MYPRRPGFRPHFRKDWTMPLDVTVWALGVLADPGLLTILPGTIQLLPQPRCFHSCLLERCCGLIVPDVLVPKCKLPGACLARMALLLLPGGRRDEGVRTLRAGAQPVSTPSSGCPQHAHGRQWLRCPLTNMFLLIPPGQALGEDS